MIGEKKIITNLFGEETILDFGLRFSGKLRKRYPNFMEIGESDDYLTIITMCVACALPDKFDNKTDSEIIDAIDDLNDAVLLSRCVEGFKSALGFLSVALSGLASAAAAVEKSGKAKA